MSVFVVLLVVGLVLASVAVWTGSRRREVNAWERELAVAFARTEDESLLFRARL